MAIKKRLLVCDCGEQFEENSDQTLNGHVNYGPWRYNQHTVRQSSANGQDVVSINFIRTVECHQCGTELFKEKKSYEVRPQATPKAQARAHEVTEPPRNDVALRIVGDGAA